MSVLTHKDQVQKLLDNPDSTIYCFSEVRGTWHPVEEEGCSWASGDRYQVILPEHKDLMEALIEGRLQLGSHQADLWMEAPENIEPDFENWVCRIEPFREFTIRPNSIELLRKLEEAEDKTESCIIAVSDIVLGDDNGSA